MSSWLDGLSPEARLLLVLCVAIVTVVVTASIVSSTSSNISGIGFCYETTGGDYLAVTPPENGTLLVGSGGGDVTRLKPEVEYVVSLKENGESEVYGFWGDSDRLSVSISGNRTFVALSENGTALGKVTVVQYRCGGENE